MSKSKSSKLSKEEIILKKLGERIKQLREDSGKSIGKFSLEIGWDKTNYRQIEKGLTNPTIKTLIKISEVHNITLSELLDFEY